MQIIPAIDIIDGKCVRLRQGDYEQKTVYNEKPYEVAKQFEDAGLKRLHLVDLDGAKAGAIKNWKVLETLASKTNLVIDFGGGVASAKDVEIILESGGRLVTVGSIAVTNDEVFTTWLRSFGAELFFLGADVRDEKIAIKGWTQLTETWIYDHLEKYRELGVHNVFCTDISRDGLLQGPSTALYKKILEKLPDVNLTASGGVSSLQDLEELKAAGCTGVIIGKAIYEGKISLADLSLFQ